GHRARGSHRAPRECGDAHRRSTRRVSSAGAGDRGRGLRMKRLGLVVLLLGACIAPSDASRTAPRRPSVSPSAQLATAGGERSISFPDGDARTIPGALPACELLQVAVDRDVFVGVLRRSSVAGITYEARAIDLQSGETHELRQLEETELLIEDVRDAVVLLRHTEDLGGGDAHVSLLRVPWRDPAQTETLDEIDLTGLGGGDAGGYVVSFADTVGWVRGFGTVRPPTEIELLPVSGGRSRAARAETGCVVIGATAKDVATVCPRGVRLIDVAHGAVRDGPAARIVLAFRRGLLWRTSADLTTSPEV